MAVTKFVDSPEEYFEKTAAPGFWGAVAGAGKGLLGASKALAENPTVRKWAIPAGIGLGAAGVGSAALGTLGVSKAMEGQRAGDTLGYRIDRGLHSLFDRIKADEAFGTSFASSLGGDSAQSLMGLAKDIVGKGYQSIKDTFEMSPSRKVIFDSLKKEDLTLAGTDNKVLLEAYHTMSKVAPTLSTDKNAVRSFLTQAATSGTGGLDFQTIKGIAEAESAVIKATMSPGG